MEAIADILIRRDGLERKEAEELVVLAKQDFYDRLEEGEMPFEVCSDWFGLEEDYLEGFL